MIIIKKKRERREGWGTPDVSCVILIRDRDVKSEGEGKANKEEKKERKKSKEEEKREKKKKLKKRRSSKGEEANYLRTIHLECLRVVRDTLVPLAGSVRSLRLTSPHGSGLSDPPKTAFLSRTLSCRFA